MALLNKNKGKSRFKKRTISSESYQKRMDSIFKKSNFPWLEGKHKFFKKADGDNLIRILPPTWNDPDHYGVDLYVHYGVGEGDSFLCIKEMQGKSCPICEMLSECDDPELVESMRAKKRVLVWLLDRNKEEDGPVLWSMPEGVDRGIMIVRKDKATGEVLLIDDVYEGYDVSFSVSGSGKKTKYIGENISRRPSEATSNDKFLDYIEANPLPDILKYYDYEIIKNELDPSYLGDNTQEQPKEEKQEEPSKEDAVEKEEDVDVIDWNAVHNMKAEDLEEYVERCKIEITDEEWESFEGSEKKMAGFICKKLNMKQPEASKKLGNLGKRRSLRG